MCCALFNSPCSFNLPETRHCKLYRHRPSTICSLVLLIRSIRWPIHYPSLFLGLYLGKEIHQGFLYDFRTYGKKIEDILDLAEVDSITLLYHLAFWETKLQCRCSFLLLQMSKWSLVGITKWLFSRIIIIIIYYPFCYRKFYRIQMVVRRGDLKKPPGL